MKVPESFPAGCEFFASFSGDEFVIFPDGRMFRLADNGEDLEPHSELPQRVAPMSERAFLVCASDCRAFAARRGRRNLLLNKLK